jgi:tRNA A37 methylthiotransferase MiaB
MGEGCREVVVRVCRIVKEGDSAAIRTDPLVYLHIVDGCEDYCHKCLIAKREGKKTHPNAKVLQSAPGAMAHRGSKMVLADIDSELNGSNNITFPMQSP